MDIRNITSEGQLQSFSVAAFIAAFRSTPSISSLSSDLDDIIADCSPPSLLQMMVGNGDEDNSLRRLP
jgi:hypothetical protein